MQLQQEIDRALRTGKKKSTGQLAGDGLNSSFSAQALRTIEERR
jgi:hypothetical protein